MAQKLTHYKSSLKSKEQRLREAFTEAEENQKTIHILENQADKLLQALKQQRSYEENLLSEHFSKYQ